MRITVSSELCVSVRKAGSPRAQSFFCSSGLRKMAHTVENSENISTSENNRNMSRNFEVLGLNFFLPLTLTADRFLVL